MLRPLVKRTLKRLSDTNYASLNWIELDKSRLLQNVEVFRQQSGSKIIPVLKANAYGHGLEQIADILNDAPVAMLAVDGYFEAGRIRDSTRHPILVMGYILPQNVRLVDTKRCSFVVQDIAGLHAFAALKRRIKIHLELNTGMNRLGLQSDELSPYLETLKQYPLLELEGVMTHLADADNSQHNSFTDKQTKTFDERVEVILAAGFQPKYIHIAQTAGSTKVKSAFANTLRIGIGTYGINPLESADQQTTQLAGLQPVLELKSTIIKIIELHKGDKVSYNGIFTAPKTMRIAILPLGYYEGVPRALSNKGFVSSGGQQLPIVGRVCMNHTMIDVSGTDVKLHDHVTVISKGSELTNSILGMQREYDLFAYSTLTNLAAPLKRIIV